MTTVKCFVKHPGQMERPAVLPNCVFSPCRYICSVELFLWWPLFRPFYVSLLCVCVFSDPLCTKTNRSGPPRQDTVSSGAQKTTSATFIYQCYPQSKDVGRRSSEIYFYCCVSLECFYVSMPVLSDSEAFFAWLLLVTVNPFLCGCFYVNAFCIIRFSDGESKAASFKWGVLCLKFACVAQMSAIESDVLLAQETPLGVQFVLRVQFVLSCSYNCVVRTTLLVYSDSKNWWYLM